MPEYTTDDIRNVALAGHGGAGKTTLAEALLAYTGVIGAPGSVANGTTVCDFDPQEKEHQHSLYPAVVNFDHGSRHVNLVDTPGYPDFLGRALPVLAAVETAAVVVDARQGVQMVTRRMMEAAAQRGLARMVVVNKIDADELDLEALLESLVEAFGTECMPINLPAGGGRSVVDCFFEPGEGPADFSSVEEAHTRIVDQVVEVDEELMELYLEQGEELEADRLHDAFESALRDGHLVPVCFTSAEMGVGIAELANVIEKVMPSPPEANRPPFRNAAGEPVEIAPDPDGAAVCHVFKVSVDAFVGKLGVFRIHRGTVTKDSQLHIGDARKPVKVGHLFALQGKDHVEIDAGVPGDICAVAKIDEVVYDAMMHASQDDEGLSLAKLDLPASMLGLAITARTRGDEQKLGDSLSKLAAEDPCLAIEHNAIFNETVIRGLGDLHLRMVIEKMKDRYNVEVETRRPEDRLPRDDPEAGRGPPPPQETDRRRGAVRRGVPEDRAVGARCRLRVRGRGRRWGDPAPVHPRGGEGRAPDPGHRGGGRVSDPRRAGHRLRRQAPLRRLQGGRVRRRREEGVRGRGQQGRPDRPLNRSSTSR